MRERPQGESSERSEGTHTPGRPEGVDKRSAEEKAEEYAEEQEFLIELPWCKRTITEAALRELKQAYLTGHTSGKAEGWKEALEWMRKFLTRDGIAVSFVGRIMTNTEVEELIDSKAKLRGVKGEG